MRIYFAGSIRGGREDVSIYLEIIKYLSEFGEVLTEHIGEASLTSFGEGETSDEFIHDRDMDWLESSDIIVAEVTNPSLGVGYEIGRAIERGKGILCLYRPQPNKKLSAMIGGSKELKVENYNTIEEAITIIKKHLK